MKYRGMSWNGVMLAVVAFVATSGAARANSYDWTWQDISNTYSGTLTTNGSCGPACELVDSITGSFFGSNITGLLPPGTFPASGFPNDNHLRPATALIVDDYGISFSLANGTEINIFESISGKTYCGNTGPTFDGCNSSVPITYGSFSVTAAAAPTPVPVPNVGLPGLIFACGALAWWGRKRAVV